jgi:hypothetical protein
MWRAGEMELFELRVYPEPTDALKDEGNFHLIWKYVKLDQAIELIAAYERVFKLMYGFSIHSFHECIENKVGQMPPSETTDDPIPASLVNGEVVAVSHTDGKRYFTPRDGFGWMDVTKTDEV